MRSITAQLPGFRLWSRIRLSPLKNITNVQGGTFRYSKCYAFPKFSRNFPRYQSTAKVTVEGVHSSPKIPKTAKNNLTALRRAPKIVSLNEKGTLYSPCTTISSCEQYDLKKVLTLLQQEPFQNTSALIPGEAVYTQYKGHDIFVLANGSVVCWGMNEEETLAVVLPAISSARIRPYTQNETEDIDYLEEPDQEGSSYMSGDIIIIRGPEEERLLDKVAFSTGIARSTKLAALEVALDNYLNSTKGITMELASGKLGARSSRKILQRIAKLLTIRGQLNLHSELMDTPELYWSEPKLEEIYNRISKNLDVSARAAILNKRLDYASEEIHILLAHINEQKSTRLEWIIIILIMVEVCFETSHFYERYREKDSLEPVR